MAYRLYRLLWLAVLTPWLAACGGMGGEDPVTGITATNFQYGQLATLTLTGNALDNAITVTSDKCSLLSLANATSSKTRQAICMVSGTGTAFFTVKSSAGYVVYTTTLTIPEPVTSISASGALGFGQQATVTLEGTPQNSAIGLKSDKCINISLAAVNTANGNTAPRTATCTVVGTGPVNFSVTNSAGTSTLYSTALNNTDPSQLSTYNHKYSQKTYVAFPTGGLTDLQLTSTGCDTVVMDANNSANARSGNCVINKTGAVQFDVKRADSTVVQTASIVIPQPQVTFKTSLGDFVVELNPTAAPITAKNFMSYVNQSPSFYNGTIFHRVWSGFMAQGGGFTSGMVAKTGLSSAITLESTQMTGLLNTRGTVAMARQDAANTATSQFFVNLVDNTFLNYASASSPGYAVFGRVISGMDVVDLMATKPLQSTGDHVPVTDITVTSATQTQ